MSNPNQPKPNQPQQGNPRPDQQQGGGGQKPGQQQQGGGQQKPGQQPGQGGHQAAWIAEPDPTDFHHNGPAVGGAIMRWIDVYGGIQRDVDTFSPRASWPMILHGHGRPPTLPSLRRSA